MQEREEVMRREEQEAEAAVQGCMQIARAKQQALLSSNSLSARGAATGMMFGGSIERNCRANPNWYQTVPAPPNEPVVTNCMGEPGIGYTCTTR